MEKMTGAKALVESLRREGVEVMFGYPGGAVIKIFDELYASEINHILVRHEQGAAHAADGFARATGKTGVCMATSGPGATNLVTGIATAHMDSSPVVAFTGQVPLPMLGNDAFQEADITGITMPITKHNYLVKDPNDIPRVIKEAFYIASTGRPGPVLIDIPSSVSASEMEFKYPKNVDLPGYKPTLKGHPLQVKRAVEWIAKAERPVLYVGGGAVISGAYEEVLKLAETANMPVLITLMGKGAFPENHPLFMGMVGMHGTRTANYSIQESDLIVAVGARFDDRVTGRLDSFAPLARVIHIDIDPAEISKNVTAHLPIVGDARMVLAAINERLQTRPPGAWLKKIEEWKREYPLRYRESDEVIKPQQVVEEINRLASDAIVVTEVGQNQMWAAQFFKVSRPRSFISSGGLGTMGFGTPAAMGAKVGCPDRTVVNIAGDGSFQMTNQELATMVENDIKVVIAILNNEYLGMVRQWQELFYDKRYSGTDLKSHINFQKLAEAYGAMGIIVERPSEVGEAIERALKSDVVTVIDFRVDREENVMPMVPAGAAISEILYVEK